MGGVTALHEGETLADETIVRDLLLQECPQWAGLPLRAAGGGTDNTMYRLGEELLVRLPRTADTARALVTERTWLPRLAPHLPLAVPEPLHNGSPHASFPHPWSVLRWIEGDVVSAIPSTAVAAEWSVLGGQMAEFVAALKDSPLMGARRADGLAGYRGGSLHALEGEMTELFERCRRLDGSTLDVDRLEHLWQESLAAPEPPGEHRWLHGDLKPTNLLARDGRLVVVIDFGGLTVGDPTAEHAPTWDLPAPARAAYRRALDIDDDTWLRARGCALAVAVMGVPYYWGTYPEFVAECLARLQRILAGD